MQKLLIQGGEPLHGEISISGAKNAALPILCAALLTDESLQIGNTPILRDIETMLALLDQMGVSVASDHDAPGSITLSAKQLNNPIAPYEMVKTMRASILVLGPLLARIGQARISYQVAALSVYAR